MTQKTKFSSRRYSKRLTAWSLAGVYALAFYGMSVGYQGLAEVLTVVGAVAVALILLYMFTGHKDLLAMISAGAFDVRGRSKP
jgi:uncharacterized membrane protein